MHHILRLAGDSPRVQPGIFMQSVTGSGFNGHSAMQVRNEIALCPRSKYGEVQKQDPNSNQTASSL